MIHLQQPTEKVSMSLRIGIDVGGTNTDAVLMDGTTVIAKIKTPILM